MQDKGRIAVTGFRAFPGVEDNPSQRLVEALETAPDLLPGAEFHLLDTSYAALPPALEAILARQPDALVMTGYSGLAEGLKLERRASALRSPRFADVTGFRPPDLPGAKAGLMGNAACDFGALEAALAGVGVACHLSDDAGEYVCNNAYYLALTHIAALRLPTRAIFVHLPAITGTALARRATGSMDLALMARGVALVARRLAQEAMPRPGGD